jgi:hypothetical protein
VVIPDLVRRAALWPATDLPDPPPEHPYEVIRRDGFTVGAMAGMSFGSVYVEALPADGIEGVLAEARSLLAERGMGQAAWFVSEASSPAGLAERLRESGMVPFEEPPFEPRCAAMVILKPPPAGPVEVEARSARSFAEYEASKQVADEAVEFSEEDRRAMEAQQRLLWELESSGGSPYRSFVAVLDGEPEVAENGRFLSGLSA